MNPEEQLAELERLAQEWEAEAAALLQAHQAVKIKDHDATADGTSTNVRPHPKAVALNSQAANARKAIETKRRGEAAEADLAELKLATEASVQTKIGALLHKRGVRADVVIRWAKSRDKVHRGQLAKAEFRTQIFELGAPCLPSVGLPEVGLVATAAEVDALFDSFDVDHSGYMDLDEAKVAFKTMRTAAERLDHAITRKALEVSSLQEKAASRMQSALHPPRRGAGGEDGPDADGAAPAGDEEAGTPAPLRGAGGLLGLFSGRGGAPSFPRRSTDTKDAKKAEVAKARQAMMRARNFHMAKGWSSWIRFLDDRVWSAGQLNKSIGHLKNRELHSGWAKWVEVWVKRRRNIDVLQQCATRMANRELIRSWERWLDVTEEQLAEGGRSRSSAPGSQPLREKLDEHTSPLSAFLVAFKRCCVVGKGG